jgi:hypothetical protein
VLCAAANQQEAESVESNPEQMDETSQNLPPEPTSANVPPTASYPNSRSKQSQPAVSTDMVGLIVVVACILKVSSVF